MNSLFSVKEKVILLTGGYGILGACMAKHLAREGAYGRQDSRIGEIESSKRPFFGRPRYTDV